MQKAIDVSHEERDREDIILTPLNLIFQEKAICNLYLFGENYYSFQSMVYDATVQFQLKVTISLLTWIFKITWFVHFSNKKFQSYNSIDYNYK